jgi:hypothetical protein
MESLFGAEMPLPVRFFIAFVLVLALIGVGAWLLRRFGGQRLDAMTRGRQPRLAVIDAAAVDGRRRLILIRRDNVEHLLMIGGPTDIVIEPNIIRAVQAGREVPLPQRPQPVAEALPRTAPLGEAAAWPLQPEVTPRGARGAQPEETEPWATDAEPPSQPAASPPRRAPRSADPLAGIAAEAARHPEPRPSMPDVGPAGGFPTRESVRQRGEAAREREAEREPVRLRETSLREQAPREPAAREPSPREPSPREPSPREQGERERPQREAARLREVQAAPAEDFNADADQNLADMAQRLEAALRRPAKGGEVRPTDLRAVAAEGEPQPAPTAGPRPAQPAEPKPAKSLYDSLEKEMASLLGRPSGKS